MVFPTQAQHESYDVVIIGGAMMGSSAAWWLTHLGFDGRILVIERDPSYMHSSTAHTNSCMRQQFSSALNVRISRFAAEFVRGFQDLMGDDRVPEIYFNSFGYLYLADNAQFADVLRENQKVQRAEGAETRLLTPEEIRDAYPFYNVDDIQLGSINTRDEGYWDGGTVFEWLRRKARDNGVEYVSGEVTRIERTADGTRVEAVHLADGTRIRCGHVVNAAGPRAARVAEMAGFMLPVEPRKRFAWVFTAETPLDRDLPLTIDPSGVHMRQEGPGTYQAGCPPDPDPAVDPTDFSMDHAIWQDHVWPVIAHRVPQFEAIRVVNQWAGHYAFNTFDQNAVLGTHPDLPNFVFLNGFSGHGLQQSPAMGRATAEWLIHGEYRTLDMTAFAFVRILQGRRYLESAVI